jgi:hypothetical protein
MPNPNGSAVEVFYAIEALGRRFNFFDLKV